MNRWLSTASVNQGLWVWPSDPKAQARVLAKVAESDHLKKALAGLAKSKDGMSNSELDDMLADNSNWMTLWVVRQLTSLGFVEYNVDLFGEPAKYRLSELGRSAFSYVTGQPVQAKAPASPAPVQPPAAKA